MFLTGASMTDKLKKQSKAAPKVAVKAKLDESAPYSKVRSADRQRVAFQGGKYFDSQGNETK